MRLKDLMSLPKEQRITEKYLYRVLLSSICSILLCMGCLAEASWAWFTVSIENTDNVIRIGEPSVAVVIDNSGFQVDTVSFLSDPMLPEGEYSIRLTNMSEADDFNQKSTLYVTFFADEEVVGYVMVDDETQAELYVEEDCSFSWIVSWFAPENAELLSDEWISIAGYEVLDEQQGDTAGNVDPSGENNVSDEEAAAPSEEENGSGEEEPDSSDEEDPSNGDTPEVSDEGDDYIEEIPDPSEEEVEVPDETTDPSDEETEGAEEAETEEIL